MRVLVVGGGGREHALSWLLAREAEVICAPGNAGIAEDVECVPLRATDEVALLELARHRGVDLVVIGPEDPLVAGMADAFRGHGFAVFGPGAGGAQLEGSKAFSKDLMRIAGVPTAAYESFTSPELAKQFARSRFDAGKQVAVKASGTALGKGVTVCDSIDQALEAIDAAMVQKVFGSAGETLVIEDRLVGREFSLLTLVSGLSYSSLPVAQDHKRALDGDLGGNTGGMGAYSPVNWISESLVRETEQRVVEPILRTLHQQGIDYRGVLFSGLMLDGDELNCLEYNVRFGDPEIEAIAMRIGGGFGSALMQCALGQPVSSPEILADASVCVVMASPGYPGSYPKGIPISVGALPDGVKVFHAGTAASESGIVSAGGRVLAVTARGADFSQARARAYEGCEKISFPGAHFRHDIGSQALS